jgi:HEAT repeat protein
MFSPGCGRALLRRRGGADACAAAVGKSAAGGRRAREGRGAALAGRLEARRNAAWALGAISDARAVEPLTGALGDSDAGVREQARWALGVVSGYEWKKR